MERRASPAQTHWACKSRISWASLAKRNRICSLISIIYQLIERLIVRNGYVEYKLISEIWQFENLSDYAVLIWGYKSKRNFVLAVVYSIWKLIGGFTFSVS